MVKTVSLLRRADHLSREEFHRWWLEEHTLVARKIPGVRKYVVSLTLGALTGEPEWDGVAEVWFDDEAALRAAFASPRGVEALADSAAHISRYHRMITREHTIIG